MTRLGDPKHAEEGQIPASLTQSNTSLSPTPGRTLASAHVLDRNSKRVMGNVGGSKPKCDHLNSDHTSFPKEIEIHFGYMMIDKSTESFMCLA